jgi:hypothetical protein
MAAEALPASQSERKLEWLGKARLHLRAADEPMMRMALTAYAARLMAASGDGEEAKKLIATIRPDVEKLANDGVAAYVRGVMAEALAAFDVPAALVLIQDLKDDGEYNRHHGNLARIVAPADPAAAIEALKRIRDDFQRDQYAVYVAPLLATVDRAQADAAVALIGYLPMQAYAEGLMADALSKVDPPAAIALVLARRREACSRPRGGISLSRAGAADATQPAGRSSAADPAVTGLPGDVPRPLRPRIGPWVVR